jgi:predicted AlkP superfamily phosphohydrolase/phosphomutase
MNHYEDVDVSCYLIDEKGEKVTIGIEVEMPESNHSKVDFETKKRNALRTYKEVIFTCPDELKKEIKEAVGKDFVFPRGVNLKLKIEKCKVQNPGHFQALTEQTADLQNSK